MMSKQKIFIIIIAVLFLISLGINLAKLAPETKNYKNYTEALKKYNNKSYTDSYYLFGKVSRFSKLKPAALYRQALCANRLNDTKTEERKYNQIIKHYPQTELSIKAKYQQAQIYYENKKFRKAEHEFKTIRTKYPQTDYALASEYYIASIISEKLDKTRNVRKQNKLKKQAAEKYKTYLKEAPTGKFSLFAIKKWLDLNYKLTNEDNLLIATVYQDNQDYKDAGKYLAYTNINESWPYFVENAYRLKDFSRVKYYTEQGLKGKGSDDIIINETINEKKQDDDIINAIDLYLKTSNNPKLAISYLLSISTNKKGKDYLLYKNCNNLSVTQQPACFNTLYYQYPQGRFAAEALTNMFLDKVKNQKYQQAKQLGQTHLTKFKNVKSTPKVIFWLAKLSERTRNYDMARSYYKQLLKNYPDDYYAYHAFLNINRFRFINISELTPKPVRFPYKDKNNELIMELLNVKDYGLINQLYGNDKFIKSWLLYQQGSFSASAKEARDAMDELEIKPNKKDLRWRLVYPLHYLDEIEQNSRAYRNDSTLILSIIREESYFNPQAQSPVGARGLMQLMPGTANEAGSKIGLSAINPNMLYDSNLNIKLGNIYFSTLKNTLMNKDILAVLAYNGGVGSVLKWKNSITFYDMDDFVEQIPYPETLNYLKKVYKSYWNYLRIYNGINE